MKITFRSMFAAVALMPVAGFAQDRATCEDYLELTPEAKLALLETVKVSLIEAGQGYRFDAEATGDEKMKYVESECTNSDAWPGLALFDVLGK